jgi:TatD DNase family protein
MVEPVSTPLPLIDAHCHLADEAFDQDRPAVIAAARKAGLVAAITMGEDYEDNLRILEIAVQEPFLFAALGHHPWRHAQAAKDVPRTLRLLEEHRDEVVAIGEVGLDYRVAESTEARADQQAVFREFIEASRILDLPLSVHVRSAGHYVVDILKGETPVRAALHAFDGKARYALDGAEAGLFFSVPATVLVSPQKQKLVRALPEERLMLESDAPALNPERGARNEPAVMARALTAVSDQRCTPRERVAQVAYENTRRFFRLPLPPWDAPLAENR